MKKRFNDGFTLIEVIVVAGIIAILAGILVPMILKEIDESRTTRASADVRSISNALLIMKKDTGEWPVTVNCTPGTTLLIGGGSVPSIKAGVAGWDTTTQGSFNDYLLTDQECSSLWKGPYIAAVTQDPWGRSYITNADGFLLPTAPVWILSAGPDGVVDTLANSNVVSGDDTGLRVR